MQDKRKVAAMRCVLLGAASVLAAASAGSAAAQTGTASGTNSSTVDDTPGITVRDDLSFNTPPPSGIIDNTVNVTGIGQVVTDQGGGFVGTCTGTLINPRTVIFAAHCVNTRAASAYGSATGGTAISVGFSAYNLPALRQWLGLDGGTRHATNVAGNLYNVEQIWYDTRSLAPASRGFLEADIALATLDTPAFSVPTWAMLFSPLTGAEHASIVGYGSTGSGTSGAIGSNWRRRAAENMVSFLGSLNDRNEWLFGTSAGLPQNLYMMDFDDPKYGQAGANPRDFNIFGGPALAREGITGPGDSGGPLIIDQKYDRPVIAGTLSGGSTFFTGQPQSSYGTHNLYQPLYLFWDQIVANNSYVYASNLAGSRDWTDPTHWVQTMDPNYMVDRGGSLVNDVPDTPALGVSGDGVQFGQVCFHADCTTPQGTTPATGSGTGLYVPGGPGSTDFVPNNVVANPVAGVRARYYDVTLSAFGETRLNSSVTIDRLTVDGPTKLDIGSGGALNVWGDFTQGVGWTHVDGSLKAAETLIVKGLLSGSGTIDPTYLTVVNGIVSPGGDNTPSTLTVRGDVILSSGSLLLLDAGRSGADRLTVVGDAANSGQLLLGGGTVVFNKAKGAAPRHGDSFVIASATGGVDGTFGTVASMMGVLRPELTYGANEITANLRAGSFQEYLGSTDGLVGAFAGALDALRGSSYNQLYGLYGSIDLMEPGALAATFDSMAPKITGEARSLQDRQSKVMLSAVTDRLSVLGNSAGGLSVVGSPYALASADRGSMAQQGFAGLVPSGQTLRMLPKGLSGFVSGGATSNLAGYGGAGTMQGQRSEYMSMGLETEVGTGLVVGSAVGYAQGISAPGTDRADSKTTQLAVYGSYQLGGGAYLGGVASAETSEAELSRVAHVGEAGLSLHGAANSARYGVSAEAGVNLGIGKGLTLTPRAQVGFANYRLGGFRENGGEIALQMNDLQIQRIEARIGAKFAGTASLGSGWAFVPQLQADYVQLLSGAENGMTVRFANAGGHSFVLPLAGGDASWAEVRGGMKLVKGRMEFGTGIETSMGRSDYRDERAVADFTFRF